MESLTQACSLKLLKNGNLSSPKRGMTLQRFISLPLRLPMSPNVKTELPTIPVALSGRPPTRRLWSSLVDLSLQKMVSPPRMKSLSLCFTTPILRGWSMSQLGFGSTIRGGAMLRWSSLVPMGWLVSCAGRGGLMMRTVVSLAGNLCL